MTTRHTHIACAVLGFLLLLAAPSTAQPPPVALPGDTVGFDYRDTDLTQYAVVRFERQVDGGTWETLGLPAGTVRPDTPAGFKTYAPPLPALATGDHTVSYRACNADACSSTNPTLAFRMGIEPAATANIRVIKSGGGPP